MTTLETAYIMPSTAHFLACEEQDTSRCAEGSSRDATPSSAAKQNKPDTPSTAHDNDFGRNVPYRFRRYLRAHHVESTGIAPSAPRDVEQGPQSKLVKQPTSGSVSTAARPSEGKANASQRIEPRAKGRETVETSGESRSEPAQPKNNNRSRSRKADAQTSDGTLAKVNEPKRRSKRLEERKATTPEAASDSQSRTLTRGKLNEGGSSG